MQSMREPPDKNGCGQLPNGMHQSANHPTNQSNNKELKYNIHEYTTTTLIVYIIGLHLSVLFRGASEGLMNW